MCEFFFRVESVGGAGVSSGSSSSSRQRLFSSSRVRQRKPSRLLSATRLHLLKEVCAISNAEGGITRSIAREAVLHPH
ncbi:hypothetical protein Q7C36_023374 [Tachysurus vachellii]|uniref:Uncharacterized protein n=1 Tax=Tachysurus vachellii TaxID=175792 RepID=A0AA88II26_TACVA|nr:hypothetical protein Q7C36_023374 [Tachysurus vachellii]